MRYCTTIAIAVIFSMRLAAGTQTSFARITSEPARFNGQRVSVVGVAYVDGDRFTLYQSIAAAKATNLAYAISIQVPPGTRKYNRFNRWWIKVTGSIDARRHGPHFGGFPCEMSLDEVRPLRHAKAKLWLTDLGEFRNKTSEPIRVKLSNSSGGAMFDLGPGGTDAVDVKNGSIVVENKSGALLFRSVLHVPPRTNAPTEPEDRVFKYSILPNGVTLVSSDRKARGKRVELELQ